MRGKKSVLTKCKIQWKKTILFKQSNCLFTHRFPIYFVTWLIYNNFAQNKYFISVNFFTTKTSVEVNSADDRYKNSGILQLS